MEGKPLCRCFEFNGVKLPDPNPKLSVEEVRALYAHQFPDIATASITGPEATGDKLRYAKDRSAVLGTNEEIQQAQLAGASKLRGAPRE